MDIQDLQYKDISLGQQVEFEEVVTENLVQDFARISGDQNPLHTNEEYAQGTQFGQRIAHGMLLAAFFSRLVGMYLPGKHCLYLSQESKFLKPVFLGEKVTVKGKVVHKTDANQLIQIETDIYNSQGERVVQGIAQALLLESEKKKEAGDGMNFKERVVLITGGSRGIGAELARSFARSGATVLINYHTNKNKAEEVLSEIKKSGGTADIFQADVADQGSVEKMITAILKKYQKIDILVNNAATPLTIKPIVSLQWVDYQKDIDVLVRGAFHTSKAVLGNMLKNKYGRIINIITTAALNAPPPNWSTYVTAKTALIGLSRSLAVEFGPHGINTNMVSPGLTETDLTSFMGQNIKMAVANQSPKKRLGVPSDVAQVVLFLASEGADYLNGLNIPVNGGTTM